MSELRAITCVEQEKVQKIIGSDACVYENGVIVDRLVSYDEIAEVVDYLRGTEKPPECVGPLFDKNWLKVGDTVTGYNSNGVFYGKVNHIDGRDVLIVMDYQCSMPFPPMLKPDLRGLEEPEQHRIEPLRIEEKELFDIKQMRKEFKELAAKWREKAGDMDICVKVESNTRPNPVERYDAPLILIDINCDINVNEIKL